MNDFLRDMISKARAHFTEEDRKQKERDSERLARWQRFKAAYESMALDVQQLDGIKTIEQRKTEKHEKLQGVLKVETEFWRSGTSGEHGEGLPAEPPWDRHYMIRLLIEAEGRPTIGFGAWLIQWQHGPSPEAKYATADKCWFDFHVGEMGTTADVKKKLAERLRARIDMSEYMPGAEGASRLGLDL